MSEKIEKIGAGIQNFLAKFQGFDGNDYVKECEKKLEEGYLFSDNESYFHILNKVTFQFYKDNDCHRLMEDISSWIEETPDDEARDALVELKEELKGVCCE